MNKKIYIGIGVGVVIVIIGFGVVLATKIWDPYWNPFQPNALNILESSINRLPDMDYFHSDFNIKIDVADAGESLGLEYKASMDVDNTSDVPNSETELSIGILNKGIKMVLTGDVVELDNIAYFRLRGIPILLQMQLSNIGINISDYADKWYRLNPQELGIEIDTSINQELMEKLTNITDQYSLIKLVKRLDSEVINDEDTYHYLFRLKDEEVKKFILGVFNLLDQELGNINSTPDDMYAELDEFFKILNPIEFEVWIGKSTHVLYKFRYKKHMDIETLKAQGIDVPAGNTDDIIDINVELSLSDINVIKEISAPEQSENLIDLFMPFFEQFNVLLDSPECIEDSCSF